MTMMEGEILAPEALLRWYLEAGVDEAVGETALDRYALSEAQVAQVRSQAPPPPSRSAPRSAPHPASAPVASAPQPGGPLLADSPRRAAESAAHLAAGARTLAELRRVVEDFDGCPLKATATHTVFADGPAGSSLMVIGEMPDRDDDRLGLPFSGEAGQLLNRMLDSIGQPREGVHVTNVLPWRPPGNRAPTDAEVAVCLPFLERHIELAQPAVLLLVGGLAAKTLFARSDGIMKLRGRWKSHGSPGLSHPIPAIATFHPAYLLRSPVHKRLAWRDLLELKQKLADSAAALSRGGGQ